ncbi:hypothetical protein [Ferrimonas marina]|uniref:Uncharacterized protein n=1 Tax=Ferrimonas marina TaxID=299255 RepID=A0A1M5YDP4_9GAMM|nr:hypothetical protein [Ferrimonas marina]SHI10106.1 hypothetical protein SAMN02745129_4120 [Ferrimonas marina]
MKKLLLPFCLAILAAAYLIQYLQLQQLRSQLAQQQLEIKTQRMMVVDKDTNPRIVLDAEGEEVTLTMLDQAGTPRLQAVMDVNDSGNLFLFDIEGNPRVGFFNEQSGEVLQYLDNVEPFVPQ